MQKLEARYASSATATKKRPARASVPKSPPNAKRPRSPEADGMAQAATTTTIPASLRGPPGCVIRVGTECSGMESVSMALHNLGVRCSLEFCCEIDKWCRNFIWQNHPPKMMLQDITCRDPATTPPCDLYVAGFPCQPFSKAGLLEGVEDSKGRGTIFEHVLSYLQAHRPRAVILENVDNLCAERFADTFKGMLQSLLNIKGIDGEPHYLVSKRLVDTSCWGLPQRRKRVYIICMSRNAIEKANLFCGHDVPPPRGTSMTFCNLIVAAPTSSKPSGRGLLPNCSHTWTFCVPADTILMLTRGSSTCLVASGHMA